MEKLSSILIIDDDPLTSKLHKRIIEGFNVAHKVDVVTNGGEAIQLINHLIQSNNEDKIPQLIFVDLFMPFMDGFYFLDEYKSLTFKNKNSVVLAVLTASFLQADKKRVKEYRDVSEYIEKPITKEKMMELMEENFH